MSTDPTNADDFIPIEPNLLKGMLIEAHPDYERARQWMLDNGQTLKPGESKRIGAFEITSGGNIELVEEDTGNG